MTVKELLRELDKLAQKLEEIETSLDNAIDEVHKINKILENIPTESEDIEMVEPKE
jgi:hypothetical protein